MTLSPDESPRRSEPDADHLISDDLSTASLPDKLKIFDSRLPAAQFPHSEAIQELSRKYVSFHSKNLSRDMELVVFGDRGTRVLMFPTRMGRFYDYEDYAVLDGVEKKVRDGELQLICVDSLDAESFYAFDKHPRDRMSRHMEYEKYILEELLPFTETLNPGSDLIASGCSLGAYHAITIALRHPDRFSQAFGFSGRYDLSVQMRSFDSLLGDHFDDDVYRHMPSRFIPDITDPARIDQLKRMRIVLAIGEKDPFFENNIELVNGLAKLRLQPEFYIWQGRAHRWDCWREMARLYLGTAST